MEFYYYSPSETFVVLTADHFVGRDDVLLQQQRKDSHVSKNSLISSDFKEKSKPSLQRRRRMEFLACDGCEDEYNK